MCEQLQLKTLINNQVFYEQVLHLIQMSAHSFVQKRTINQEMREQISRKSFYNLK